MPGRRRISITTIITCSTRCALRPLRGEELSRDPRELGGSLHFVRRKIFTASNAGVPLVAEIFPKTATSAARLGEGVDSFDAHHVLRHPLAELPLAAEP